MKESQVKGLNTNAEYPSITTLYFFIICSLEMFLKKKLREDGFPLQLRVKGKTACSQLHCFVN